MNKKSIIKRIWSVLLIFLLVFSLVNVSVVSDTQAASTSLSKHGRLSVKGADLVDKIP